MTLPKNVEPCDLIDGGRATATKAVDGMTLQTGTTVLAVEMNEGRYDFSSTFTAHEGRIIGLPKDPTVHLIALPDWSLETVRKTHRAIREAAETGPWRHEAFWTHNCLRWIEHIPQPSKETDGMLAYYDSPQHRARGRLTTTKSGRYLRRFFGDLLDQPEIERLAHAWEGYYQPAEVYITKDASEAVEAYKNAYLGSCMAFTGGEYAGREHPAVVFDGTDLAVAVIGGLENPTGRCVVWPDKKIFLRGYGDERRMSHALEAIGYRRGNRSEFEGARLARIEEEHNLYVLPYLDMTYYVRDDGTYLIVDPNGTIDAQNTNGLGGDANPCADCGDGFNPDYGGAYVDDVGHVCDWCIENRYSHCEHYGEFFPNDEMADCVEGLYISQLAAEGSGDYFYCEATEVYHSFDGSDRIVLADGRQVSMTWAEDNTEVCEITGEYYESDDPYLLFLSGGWVIHTDDAFGDDMDGLHQWLHHEGHRPCPDRTPRNLYEHLTAVLDDMAKQLEMELEAA